MNEIKVFGYLLFVYCVFSNEDMGFASSLNCSEICCPSPMNGRGGRDGAPGRDGLPGKDGISINGLHGRDGRDGKEGPKGSRGQRGHVGLKGSNGKQGMKGVHGMKGERGEKGEKGEKVLESLLNKNGDKGDPGLTGRQGKMGKEGAQGVIGPRGEKGEKGDQGENGKDCIISKKVLADIRNEIATIKKENEELKKKLSNLFSGNKLNQNLLPAGYDRFSVYDIQWQSLHMAAAAACRGSTPFGGNGTLANKVISAKPGKTCTEACAETEFQDCEAQLSIYGLVSKASKTRTTAVGSYHNFGCDTPIITSSEGAAKKENIVNRKHFISYCCCSKEK